MQSCWLITQRVTLFSNGEQGQMQGKFARITVHIHMCLMLGFVGCLHRTKPVAQAARELRVHWCKSLYDAPQEVRQPGEPEARRPG